MFEKLQDFSDVAINASNHVIFVLLSGSGFERNAVMSSGSILRWRGASEDCLSTTWPGSMSWTSELTSCRAHINQVLYVWVK